jgi:glycogen debranching enzyme
MTRQGLHAELRSLLLRNVRDGYSKLLSRSYCYIAPAPGTYPYQWFWDTCFHVVMLARLGEYELAKKNLRSLFAMQEDNGFVGHMIFWNQVLPRRRTDVLQARPSWQALRPHMSALIQPPLVATALEILFEACGDRVFLGEMYAPIQRYHDWLARERDFGDGLLTLISPFESGMDWKASYDPVIGCTSRRTPRSLLRSRLFWKVVAVDLANFMQGYELERIRRTGRFLLQDAGFNAIYATDLQAMERLAVVAGDDPSRYAQRRRRVASALLERSYDADAAAFYDLACPGARKLRIDTATMFFPLAVDGIADEIAERVLERHFDDAQGFGTPYPLPSLAVGDPAFYPGETPFLWRGPTWACINWFMHRLLQARGFDAHARRLRESLWRLIERSGFREYYDPFTGEGHGARDFTWSGLVIDMA